MKDFNKEKNSTVLDIILGILYILISIPMLFSMYNSVPACDDFAFGANSISDNLLINAAGFSAFCWVDHSGRWLLYFLQKLVNPMNIHSHLGRIYGAWMIVLFLVTTCILYYSLKIILGKLLELQDKYLKLAIFLIISILFTTFYYVEVFNWYIGGTAYALPFVLLLLMFAFYIKYEETLEKKYYVGIILAGLIPATNEIFDVPLGVLYLYLAFYVYGLDFKDRKKLVNRLFPLLLFIIGGISVVFAPGNLLRQADYEVKPSASVAAKQVIIDIIVRLKDVILNHSFSVILFMGLVLLGIFAGKMKGKNNIFITAILTLVGVFGSVFPYVYGRGMTTTYLDVRVQYLFDYILFIGIGIGCIRFGRLISPKCIELFKGKKLYFTGGVLCLLFLACFLFRGAYLKLIPVDIFNKRELIAESYDYWNGIILEIETSNESNVVIEREEEPAWTPYFLYMGLVEEDIYDLPLDSIFSMDIIMPNVYYQKESIKYQLD